MNVGAGSINSLGVSGGTLNVAGDLTINGAFSPSGTVNVNSGTLTLNAPTTNSGMLKVAAGGTIQTNNASLTNTSTGVLGGSGLLRMSGTTPGTLLNNGVIAPGGAGALGTLTVLGDVNFGVTGSLNAERFSNLIYDKLVVSGNATLAGTFGLTNATPQLLPDGSTYTVLTYASSAGTFTTVNLPLRYSAVYLADRLNITTPNLAAATGSTFTQATNQVVTSMSMFSQPLHQFQTTTTIGTGPSIIPARCGTGNLNTMVACTP
jgi:hypothetical protein